MRFLHLTVKGESGEIFHPPGLLCYNRNCEDCDLRFQCFTKKKFVMGTVADEADYININVQWLIDNLEYHFNGVKLVWKNSKMPQRYGEVWRTFGDHRKI